ncbi:MULTISPECIES: TonB-dependent siderophore receptor [Pacificibacter]|uniref:TonB-dependent siderophore receptor n=1 Tax=Pacificibacter TaxID=1042323 RepID=UPI001C09E14D|nr:MULTISPECIES: TonB-dependent siderophore receptor [Pacificibacter]MBU2934562.1 TonB-dependent siderophore receptor [Pacificibacter marinus]MDO6617291.1 TonB-dependent siderophore receptor [Pacificibacter sp. 1_MG-2023]
MTTQTKLVGLLLASTALWGTPSLAQDAASSDTFFLEEITVEGLSNGAIIDGYRADTVTSATRTATPLNETPQSVQVISPEVMQDQAVTTMAEALNNVSGAQGNIALQTPAFESTILRGFPAEFYRDGITSYINTGDANAMAGVERIEVLKGPNAILYGGGVGTPLGGVVNVVSKKPVADNFTTLGLTYGSNAFVEPSFDINRQLSDTVLFRINGSYVKSASDVDVLETERYSISPSLTFGHGTDTRVTVQGYASKWQQQEYQGLPATGTVIGDFDIARDLYIGDSDIPDSATETRKLTVSLEHDFNENWSNKTQFRYGENTIEQITQIIFSNTPDAGASSWNLYNSYVPSDQTEYSFNTSFEGHFTTGLWDHTVLFGADYSRIEDYSLMYMDYAGSMDLVNPNTWPDWTMPSTLAMGEGNGTYTTAGVFAQLQTTIGDLHLLGGVRLAYLETIYDSEGYGRKDILQDTRLLPRLGAVYDVTDSVSIFASYSEGMKANAFRFYSDTPKPEYSRQAEIGVKFDTGTLTGSLAAYRIERENVPVTDPDDPWMLTSLTEGVQRSQGIELDAVWQSGGPWKVIANYAYTDAELMEDIPNGATAGSKLPGVPSHSGGLWVDYDMREMNGNGWRVGAGLHAASSSYIDQENAYETAGYAVVNASASYTQAGTTYALAIKNLMDTEYDLPLYGYLGGRVAAGAERQFFLSISKTF